MKSCELWERPQFYIGKCWDGWYVGLGRNRDSDTLTRSNFEVFFDKVTKASDGGSVLETGMGTEYVQGEGWLDKEMEIDTVYIAHESHWAVGWVEWIAIHKSDKGALAKANELLTKLDAHPVLDEDHWGELETKEIDKFWKESSLAARIDICREAGDSIFAARCDYPPENSFNYLRDTWN